MSAPRTWQPVKGGRAVLVGYGDPRLVVVDRLTPDAHGIVYAIIVDEDGQEYRTRAANLRPVEVTE